MLISLLFGAKYGAEYLKKLLFTPSQEEELKIMPPSLLEKQLEDSEETKQELKKQLQDIEATKGELAKQLKDCQDKSSKTETNKKIWTGKEFLPYLSKYDQ